MITVQNDSVEIHSIDGLLDFAARIQNGWKLFKFVCAFPPDKKLSDWVQRYGSCKQWVGEVVVAVESVMCVLARAAVVHLITVLMRVHSLLAGHHGSIQCSAHLTRSSVRILATG